MKIQNILLPLLLVLGLAATQAQERAATFDAEAARAKLSGEVAKTPPKFLTKGIGGDPVTKRFYTKDAIVVTHASGAKEEHPYVAVPCSSGRTPTNCSTPPRGKTRRSSRRC